MRNDYAHNTSTKAAHRRKESHMTKRTRYNIICVLLFIAVLAMGLYGGVA